MNKKPIAHTYTLVLDVAGDGAMVSGEGSVFNIDVAESYSLSSSHLILRYLEHVNALINILNAHDCAIEQPLFIISTFSSVA